MRDLTALLGRFLPRLGPPSWRPFFWLKFAANGLFGRKAGFIAAQKGDEIRNHAFKV